MTKKGTIVNLKPTDSAILIQKDGSYKLLIPPGKQSEIVNDGELLATMIICSLNDPVIFRMMEDSFNKIVEKTEQMTIPN